ncbi:MAG: prevent-host-death family protein [Deltaproteobacteria bacterium RIFOXYA12_FULL_58_15]|nr:MAG: prevent-host-death family protein [Deltaproteobacteria bacterium RIFOXYA12_FULL_58_15]OGR15020.1 MAG: prevent-host-death family protein [Deltaproteobacteria bacterium RIFOXYB12_FULL_58_9]
MVKLTTTEARKDFSSVVDAAYARSERVVLTRNGKSVAAVVPIADLEALEDFEDRMDIKAAQEALNEPGPNIPWEEVKTRLGL